MVTLNNPINSQNVVDRFKDFVTDIVNTNVSWGTGSKPFPEMPDETFNGSITGSSISIVGDSIGALGTNITASNIVNTLLAETALYTNIRNLRAILFVDGLGGNSGTRTTEGIVFDQTKVANLATTYRQTLNSVSTSNNSSGNIVYSSNLETFFTNLQTEYNTTRSNIVTIQVNVCHASCHSSCHSNRGRR